MVSADSGRIGEVEFVGTVELVYMGKLLRLGCDSLLMPVCNLLELEGLYQGRMGYHGNIQLENRGGGGGEERRGEDREPNYVACSALIMSRWLVVAWWLPVTICQTCPPCPPGG